MPDSVCPQCSMAFQVPPGALAVCPRCGFGAQMPSEPAPSAPAGPPPQQGSGSRKTLLIVGIVVGAVCLLVVVTIVMAAVVFVLVSDLGGDQEEQDAEVQTIAFEVRQSSASAWVTSVEDGVQWSNFTFVAESGGHTVRSSLNGPPSRTAPELPFIPPFGLEVQEGDVLRFCVDAPDRPDVEVGIVHTATGTRIATFLFLSMTPCW